MSRSLNSCRTSKRGIADKPQCPSNSFRLQILIAFTIESGKPYAYLFEAPSSFYWDKSFLISSSVRQVLQSLSSREPKMEEGVLGTFRFCSLSLPSRNTLHTDQVALTIHLKLHPTIVNAPILLIVTSKIKTRKLLGDYSSENSECNRRELRTLEIYFLESV